MKTTTIILSLLIFSISGISACGSSKSEVEAKTRLKAVQDSISAAIDVAMQDQLKQQLIDLKAKLEVAQVNHGDVEQFKLLRSKEEKSQQIEAQTKVVEQLKSQIGDIEKKIR